MTTTQTLPTIETTSLLNSTCEITAKHISEMYGKFESGLCDQTTCNAVALALSQILGQNVRVFHRKGSALLKVRDEQFTLPEPVHAWLDLVDKGLPVEPFHFEIPLPIVLMA